MRTPTPPTAADQLTVTMPSAKAPGVRSFGPYKLDIEYTLPRAEAERLVACKGFEIVTAAASADAPATTED